MTDATAQPLPAVPPYTEAFRQKGRTALVVLVALTGVVGLLLVLVFALSAGDAAGAGASIVFAMLPLPLLWFVYWWLDRYEPEPRRYKIAAFVWGGVVAVAIALVLQIAAQEIWGLSDEVSASVVAPLTEEPAKCLFLLVVMLRARRIVDGVLDGLILAGLVGIGFAFVENIGYYASSWLGSADFQVAGAAGVTSTFVVRGVFSPFAHPLFTSAFGIALGLAVVTRSRTLKVVYPVVGLAISIALHALWNGSLSYGIGAAFLVVYLGLAVALVITGVVMVKVRNRQVRVLERSLSYVAQRGWVHPDEIPYLSRFEHRKAARSYARSQHGREAARVVTRYQRLATEMAFLHDALMAGRSIPHGVERTYALLDAMYALRPALRFPPALRV